MLPAPAPVAATTPEPHLWLSRYGSEIFRFVRRRVATVSAAEEPMQETIVSVLGTLALFRQESSERTWLFVILRRKFLDYYRQQACSPLVPFPCATAYGQRPLLRGTCPYAVAQGKGTPGMAHC